MLLASLLVAAATCALAPVAGRIVGRTAAALLAVPLLASAILLLVASASGHTTTVVPWIPSLGIELSLRLDGLGLLFGLLVTVIGAAVLVYCTRYLPSGRHRSFLALMTGFAAAMLLLVLADDVVVLFVAWELTTLCSFFLIGRSGDGARDPAIRTLLVTAAGGLVLLGAVVAMVVVTGTTSLSGILASDAWTSDPAFASWMAVLIAVAAFTKSAQFPFQAWLPDSMVAITPVSAYLHAAAMVKAGIYLLFRFSPVLADHAVWTSLLIASGLITALLGAVAALRRHDLKEILAYSTISQLGLLVAMIGVGTEEALTAAVVHTVAHALFKSALFLLVGVVDHEAGTRDIRDLAGMRLRMPVTAIAMGLASASMAGVPPLLGFISKESMFEALVQWPSAFSVPVALAVAMTAVFTFAYSGRLVLGAFGGGRKAGGPGRAEVREGGALLIAAPVGLAAAGVALGVAPALLDALAGDAASSAAGTALDTHLALWHGLNLPLAISAAVIASGVLLIVRRRRVDALLAHRGMRLSGLSAVDATRAAIIRGGAQVSRRTGSLAPRRHLTIPVLCVIGIAVLGMAGIDALPDPVGDAIRWYDWVLVALVAIGVTAAVLARTRIAAIVVTGAAGFAMTLWFLALGAVDVALTQLLVEILTVCVMVLVLQRLPRRFRRERARSAIPAALIAVAAGLATTLAVWAMTGRRELSDAADYYLRQGEEVTGGANIVNTILVDFRALDTLGEVTVLGVAGVAIAALLGARRAQPVRPAEGDPQSHHPLADSERNTSFARVLTRVVGPLTVLLSVILLFRGHQEPGGGFIAALIGGAGFALLYLSAPTDRGARIRWPYIALIGGGVVVGAGTGLLGFLEGSFLTPLHVDVLGLHLTTALVFDVGVYLAVIGVVLAALNLLGVPGPSPARASDRSEKVAS